MAEKLEKQLAERKAEKKKEKPSQKPKQGGPSKGAQVDTKGITVGAMSRDQTQSPLSTDNRSRRRTISQNVSSFPNFNGL